MSRLLFIFLLTSSNMIFSQSEIEIIGVKYRTTTKNDHSIYHSNNNKLDAFINYGHDLGKRNKIFYHLSYHNVVMDTEINSDNIVFDDAFYFPNIPSYSFINLASGLTNKLNNKWNLTNIISATFSGDFGESTLKQHLYFRTFNYVKKERSKNFNYGFGVYLSKLNNDLSIYPILSLQLKNNKRGMKIFLPRELKFWNKINSKSYLELKTIFNSNYIKFNNKNLDVEILSINSELTYNYIYKQKIKIQTGIGIPYSRYKYITNRIESSNQTNFSLVFGIKYIVFKKEK